MAAAKAECALSVRFCGVAGGTARDCGTRGLCRLEGVAGDRRGKAGVRAVFPECTGACLGWYAQRIPRLSQTFVGAVCHTVAVGFRSARAGFLGRADSARGCARMNIARRKFDCLVIGAGGGGLRAALQLAEGEAHVAVVSKVFPTRSHTPAGRGGDTPTPP